MNNIQALAELKNIVNHDPEVDHKRADEILCEFIRSLGYSEIADAFDEVEKWYA